MLTLGAAGRHLGMYLPLQLSRGFPLHIPRAAAEQLSSRVTCASHSRCERATAGHCCSTSRAPARCGAPPAQVTAAQGLQPAQTAGQHAHTEEDKDHSGQ